MSFVLAERAVNWENAASRRREGRRVRTARGPRSTRAMKGIPTIPLLVMVE
jgi:hypothetical protein